MRVVALCPLGSVGVHLGCFPPIRRFIYKFPVRKHCLSGIWLVEIDLVCTGTFRCGRCDHSRVGLGISELTWNVFYVLYM